MVGFLWISLNQSNLDNNKNKNKDKENEKTSSFPFLVQQVQPFEHEIPSLYTHSYSYRLLNSTLDAYPYLVLFYPWTWPYSG